MPNKIHEAISATSSEGGPTAQLNAGSTSTQESIDQKVQIAQKTSGLQTDSGRKHVSTQHAVTHKNSDGATIQQNQDKKKARTEQAALAKSKLSRKKLQLMARQVNKL